MFQIVPVYMQFIPWIAAVPAIAILVMLVAMVLRRSIKPLSEQPLPTEWALTSRPVFNTDERRAYRLLRDALPHHVILSKLPLIRFCQPIDPTKLDYWYGLLGNTSVSFAICSATGRVLAAIDLDNERVNSSRVWQIKQEVFAACRVRYLHCVSAQFPSIAELQLLVPTGWAAFKGPQPAAMPYVPLDEGQDRISKTKTSRKATRTTLWQDSVRFQDSFFAQDARLDAFTETDFPHLQPTGSSSGIVAGNPSGQDPIHAEVGNLDVDTRKSMAQTTQN